MSCRNIQHTFKVVFGTDMNPARRSSRSERVLPLQNLVTGRKKRVSGSCYHHKSDTNNQRGLNMVILSTDTRLMQLCAGARHSMMWDATSDMGSENDIGHTVHRWTRQGRISYLFFSVYSSKFVCDLIQFFEQAFQLLSCGSRKLHCSRRQLDSSHGACAFPYKV